MTDNIQRGAEQQRSLVERFVDDGYVRLDDAFPRAVADECRSILWRETGCSPDDPSTWTRPVVRLLGHAEPPFRAAAAAPALTAACDALVGRGAWQPMVGLGTFPIRFPSTEDPGDGRLAHRRRLRVGDRTRLPEVAHQLQVAWQGTPRALPVLRCRRARRTDPDPCRVAHDDGPDPRPVRRDRSDARRARRRRLRRDRPSPRGGRDRDAGTVYLCHPFLVHAAQRHRGSTPKFMAQPPVVPTDPAGPPTDSIVMRSVT